VLRALLSSANTRAPRHQMQVPLGRSVRIIQLHTENAKNPFTLTVAAR